MSAAREGWTERILSVSSPFRRTKKPDTHLEIWFFVFGAEGTQKTECRCPVGICSIPAGRNRHHSVSSPFRHAKKPDTHLEIWFFVFGAEGTQKTECRCPVGICSIPAGRNRYHSVSSPFHRIIIRFDYPLFALDNFSFPR